MSRPEVAAAFANRAVCVRSWDTSQGGRPRPLPKWACPFVPKANTLGPAPGEEQGFVFQADGSVGQWWVSGEDVGATTATGSAGASTPHAVRELFTKPAPHVPQSAPLNVESSEEDEDEDEMDERWDLFLETAAEGGGRESGDDRDDQARETGDDAGLERTALLAVPTSTAGDEGFKISQRVSVDAADPFDEPRDETEGTVAGNDDQDRGLLVRETDTEVPGNMGEPEKQPQAANVGPSTPSTPSTPASSAWNTNVFAAFAERRKGKAVTLAKKRRAEKSAEAKNAKARRKTVSDASDHSQASTSKGSSWGSQGSGSAQGVGGKQKRRRGESAPAGESIKSFFQQAA